MSYDLFVDNENIGQIASNGGWHDTAEYLDKHGKVEAKRLVNQGVSFDTTTLDEELESIAKSAPAGVKSIIEEIRSHLAKADHVGISQEGADESAKMSESVLLSRPLENRLKWHGLDISIENDRDSEREWTDRHGKKGKTVMKFPYGYIRVRSNGK